MKHSIIDFRNAKPVRIVVWTPWGDVPTSKARTARNKLHAGQANTRTAGDGTTVPLARRHSPARRFDS